MTIAPFGSWTSPLAAADLARSAGALNYLQVFDGQPSWIESRPSEGGRCIVATLESAGHVAEHPTGGEFNVRSRVHEYGGAPFIFRHGTLYFCHFDDQRVYARPPGGTPEVRTPAELRYADFDADPVQARLYCVREDHSHAGEARNAIVALDARRYDGGTVLFEDSDFVAYPRVSPDGRMLAWIAWNHPDMPWDATTLYVGQLRNGVLQAITAIAGGPHESVLEPRWGEDGVLYFISDRTGWWNLYRYRDGTVTSVFTIAADLAGPLWTLGQSTYALSGDGRVVFRYSVAAQDRLGVAELGSGRYRELDLPFNNVIALQRLSGDAVVAIAASATTRAALVRVDARTGTHQVLRRTDPLELDSAYISRAEPVEFDVGGEQSAHAFYYPPRNRDFQAPAGEKPPLIVKAHGGPTSHAKPDLQLAVQFWTTRGFAFLDVNYGGSTGFGRAYRDRLQGELGVRDVGDVVAAARHAIEQGWVDGHRVAIRGGSSGGFVVLAALAFHDVFGAGANYYGISDLAALMNDTHKFESRYLDRLIAPLPRGRALCEARSPIHHLQGFSAPLITFQGTDDKVVPPAQSRAIVTALRARGLVAEYHEFQGEQHGFRRAENIIRSLEQELDFYGRVLWKAP